MRSRDAIKELNALGGNIEWPSGEAAGFNHFKHMLKRVIGTNLDYPTVNTLEYCEDGQVFYITLSVGGLLAGPFSTNCGPTDSKTGLRLERLFEINPREPLTAQINLALKAHEDMKDRHQLLQLLLNEHLGRG